MRLFQTITVILLLVRSTKGTASGGSLVSVASTERINVQRRRTHQGRLRTLKGGKDSSYEESLKGATRPLSLLPSSSPLSKKASSGKGNSKGSKKGKSKSKSSKGTVAPTKVTVDITNYFIAYSVPGLLQEPTPAVVEQLRKQTKQYWTEFFQEHFAVNTSSDYGYDGHIKFSGIDLEIADTKFGQDNPPEYLDFYVEYDMKLLYELGSANPPDVAETFDIIRYQSDLNTRYVTDFVTSIPLFSQTDFILFDAVDTITLSPTPTSPPGGTVEIPAPEFSLAYDIPRLTEPTSFQLQQLIETTHSFLFDDSYYRLPSGYSLYEIRLTSTSAAFNAGTPDASYNYYVTFDAVFVISEDDWADSGDDWANSGDDWADSNDDCADYPVPTPEDIFEIITTIDLASYILYYVSYIEGFETIKRVVLETNSLPPTFKEKVPAHFIAYGVPGLVSEPSPAELQQLADSTQSFWNGVFADYFSASDVVFLEVELLPVHAYYNAGIPEPQYNYWVDFDVTVLFDGQGAKPPLALELFQIMQDANFVPYILDHVRSIPGFETNDEIDFRLLNGTTTGNNLQLDDLFIAYRTQILAMDPSSEEIDELVALTRQFFHWHLIQQFQDFGIEGYVNVELTLLSAGSNNIPEPGIYEYKIHFNVNMSFAPGFSAPDTRTAYEILAFYADLEKYRRKYVLSIDAFVLTEYLYLDIVKESFEIQVPAFALFYDIPGLMEPTSFQLEQLVEMTSSFLWSDTRLPEGYLVIEVKSDFTQTGTLDDKSFNYYVRYEAVFVVSKEIWAEDPVPTSDDMLELISTADFPIYILYYVRNIPGFETTKKVGFESTLPLPTFKEKVLPHFIAYGVPGLASEPSPAELQQLADSTQSFWSGVFADYFSASDVVFLEVELSPVQAYYNAGIPKPQYNYWVDFDVTVLFDGQGAKPPLALELFQIMSDADFAPYTSDHISSIPGFETIEEVDFRLLNGTITGNNLQLDDLFIAFSIVDLFVEPSAEEINQLVAGTRQFFHSHLVEYFKSSYVEGYMNTELTLLEAGTSNVPDFYNYMIRFNLVVNFAPGFQIPDMWSIYDALAFWADLELYRRKYVAPIDAFTLTQYLYLDRVMDTMLRLDYLFFELSVPDLEWGIWPPEDDVYLLIDNLRLFWEQQLYNLLGGDVFSNVDLLLGYWGPESTDMYLYNFVVEFDMIISFVPGSVLPLDPDDFFYTLLDLATAPTLLPNYITTISSFQSTIEATFGSRNLPSFVKKDAEIVDNETVIAPPPSVESSEKTLSLEELLKKSAATNSEKLGVNGGN